VNTIMFDQAGPVGWVRLNRPDKLNAMTGELWRELAGLGRTLMDDPTLRCVVVIGNGRAFSAGIDTSSFGGVAAAGDGGALVPGDAEGDPIVASVLATQEAFNWLEDAPFPTIAAVRGFALGAGLQLALAADLRIVADGTKLGMLELQYGLMPDLGGTQRLPRIVGTAKARELIFTATKIDADEALRIGLANMVVADADLESIAGALAERLAAQPPIALRNAKQALNHAFDATARDGLRWEAVGQAECIRSDDFKEAVAAFVERRPAVFQNR
jgi:enoyl-CoA hydratase/carnithine racemase